MSAEVEATYVERKRWLFFGLPFTFTKYIIREDVVRTNEGFFNLTENDCYMYKIQDVQLNRSLLERLFGLGTVVCYTGDVTDKMLCLNHIRNAQEVKDYILQASEEARLKRRTIHTQNIGVDSMDDLADE